MAEMEIPQPEAFAECVGFPTARELPGHVGKRAEATVEAIGISREERPLYGVRCGTGPATVSVIAGCHADEPAGPMTASCLPSLLARHAPELLERFSFRIVPQMNPDGAERNRAWFRERLDLNLYIEHVVRELPGDDVEFGFGDDPHMRPECRAAQTFLSSGAPYAAHFSLHGMGFSEGAWCLIHPSWRDRSTPFQAAFAKFCADNAMPLHDIDRHGEKGFERIAPGFCTTPNSTAMREYFLAEDDSETAEKFRPSSMEWIASLGGAPLAIVSEMPLFRIGKRTRDLNHPVSAELRAALTACRAGRGSLESVVRAFDVTPMPFETQIQAQFAMIVLSLRSLIDAD